MYGNDVVMYMHFRRHDVTAVEVMPGGLRGAYFANLAFIISGDLSFQCVAHGRYL